MTAFTKFRDDIVNAYGYAIRLLEDKRDLALQTMESLQTKAYEAVSAAIFETQENCICGDFQPTSDCAKMIWKHAHHQLEEEIALFHYNLSISEDAVRSCVTGKIDFDVRELAESEAGREMQEWIKSANQACQLEILPGLEIPAKVIYPFSQSCKLAEVQERPPRDSFRHEKHSRKTKQDSNQDCTFPGSGPQMDQWICSKCGHLNGNFPISRMTKINSDVRDVVLEKKLYSLYLPKSQLLTLDLKRRLYPINRNLLQSLSSPSITVNAEPS